MISAVETAKLRKAYGDIRQGYSVVKIGKDTVYIKHLSSVERGDIDTEYINFYENAVSKGLITEQAKLIELSESGEWTDKDDKILEDARLFLKGLNDTKSTLLFPSQLVFINKDISRAEEKLNSLINKKTELLGFTAEVYANKKLNELYIYYSLFKDKELKNLYVQWDDIELMTDFELGRLIQAYNEKMSAVNDDVIKKVALAKFFQDLYSLCDKDIYKFFGKPIADLTYAQCDLAIYGRFFYFVFTDNATKPNPDIADDPDKVIEWYNTSKNATKELEKRQVKSSDDGIGAQSLVGATKADYESMGMKMEGESLNDIAKRKGGKIKHEEMIAILKGGKV